MRRTSEEVDHIWVQNVDESNLSRIYQHILNHDCAIMSAFKYELVNCRVACSFPEGHKLTRGENELRNRELRATLLESGYGVTPVDGGWIEGYKTSQEKEYKEDSFFVVNLNNDPSFVSKVTGLGEIFCQDSVLIKGKGTENAYLVGTNNSKDPGYGVKSSKGIFHGGETGRFLSRIRNRPFKFEIKQQLDPLTRGYETGPVAEKILGVLNHLQGRDS